MADPGGWARRLYLFRTPFVEAWARHSPAFHGQLLAYWLTKAADDPWAFAQLQSLADHLRDAGKDVPKPLEEFVWRVGVGRVESPPSTRRGPKSNMRRDVAIATAVLMLQEDGASLRKAAAIVGEHLNLSPEAILSARRRARSV